MKRVILGGCLAVLIFLLLAVPAGAQDVNGTIRVAKLDWEGARAIQNILATVLEDELDFQVEWIDHVPGTLLPAMDRGEVDVFPDLWMPDQAEGWALYIAAGSRQSVRVNASPYIGSQGLYVPGYLQEEHGIHRVEDLLSPEKARLFDSDGDGKGEIWPGPPGWSAREVQSQKIKSAGLEDLFTYQDFSETEFQRHVREAYKARRPVVFYYWTPDALHARHELRQLTDSAAEEAAESKVYVGYRHVLTEEHPSAAHFLRRVAFTPQMINGWTLLLVEFGLSPQEMARTWIEENREVVDAWLAP